MPMWRHISMVGTYTMHGRLDSDGYGYTRGHGSGRVVILSTGRVRVRGTVLCYGYGSGSKNAVTAALYGLNAHSGNEWGKIPVLTGTSLNVGGPMHGPSPTSNFGGTVPPVPPGLRPWSFVATISCASFALNKITLVISL